MKNYLITGRIALILTVLTGSVLFVQSCASTSETDSVNNDSLKPKGDQTLYFTHKDDGRANEYEVIFSGDKISALYLNGNKIPDSEIKDYEDIIYNKLNSMRKGIKEDEDVFNFSEESFLKFNPDEFKEKMKEFRDRFKEDEFKFEFNKEKFKADMKKLKEEMKNNGIVINLDKEKMKEQLREFKEQMKDFEFPMPEINIDFNDLDDTMREIKIRIKKDMDRIHEVDFEKLEKDLEGLKEKMGDLSVKMEGLETELEKLHNFLPALKQELVKDNLINSADDNLDLELSADKMSVNGKDVTGSLFTKYKSMYENHFDKKLEGKKKFKIK
jgi:hypothetical protein